jgi:queuosine precursor transporter
MTEKIKYFAIFSYIATIPLANWMIGNVGVFCVPDGPCMIPLGFGIFAPSGVLMVGLSLVLRDFVQEYFGSKISIIAIIIGAILSFLIADPFIAIASTSAFLISELADFSVYSLFRKKSRAAAIAASGLIGAIFDSIVFLWLAFGSLAFIEGQILGKVVISILAALFIKYRK